MGTTTAATGKGDAWLAVLFEEPVGVDVEVEVELEAARNNITSNIIKSTQA